MKAKRWLLFVFSPLLIVLVGSAVATGSYFTDPENSADNALVISTNYWMSGWAKRVKLTIDQNDIDSALSNFPILVYLSTSSGRNNDDVSFVFDELQSDANRKKIAVTTFDGITQCYVEIEKWDDANEEAWLWVKVPSISSSMDTDLFLYYDSTHADNTVYVGDPNSTPAENVWDSSFRLVTHLQDDPDTRSVRDSTSNNNDGTKSWWGQPAVTMNGRIDDAQYFDGFNDEIDHQNATSLQITPPLTVEAWAKPDTSGAYYGIVSKAIGGTPMRGWNIAKHNTTNKYRAVIGTGSADDILESNSAYTDTNWHYLVLRHTGTTCYLYVDGVQQTDTSTTAISDSGNDFRIGRQYADYNGRWWDGIVDEVRLSNTDRSAAWIKASYQSEIDDLLDFGSEETP